MMTSIAHFTLLIAALLDLCGMLLPEMRALQMNGHSNSRYYSWLVKGDELTAPRRLVVLAVLICCCTTMARTSWMVIIFLGIILLVQGIALMLNKANRAALTRKRSRPVYCAAIVLALLAASAAYAIGSRQDVVDAAQAAATIAVITLALTPLLAMLANWLLSPLKNGEENDQDKS